MIKTKVKTTYVGDGKNFSQTSDASLATSHQSPVTSHDLPPTLLSKERDLLLLDQQSLNEARREVTRLQELCAHRRANIALLEDNTNFEALLTELLEREILAKKLSGHT